MKDSSSNANSFTETSSTAVDLPNSLDHEWEIDVRKSKATLPPFLKSEFKRIAKITRDRAVTVYRHRGKTIARSAKSSPIFVWQNRVKGKKVSYAVNREHPLVKEALGSDTITPSMLERLLRLVEEYIPIQQVWVDAAEGSETQSQPFEDAQSKEVQKMIQMLYKAYLFQGLSHELALDRLHTTEGFGDRYELIETALNNLQNGDG